MWRRPHRSGEQGLGVQDSLIAECACPQRLVAEAAFHFSSRRAFFEHCYRVLRPGGVVTMSDVAIQRWPRGPLELLSGLTQLRVFGLR